jgi:hypothetical protein
MPRRRLAVSIIALLALPALAAVAYAKTYDVASALGSTLSHTKAKTPLAILLPSHLTLDYDGRTYASGTGGQRSYSLSLAGARNCGGATACFLVTFTARRDGHHGPWQRVALRGGRTGWFRPLSCGGSCSPPAIEWVSRGNLYGIQAKIPDSNDGGQRRRLVAAANSAIGAGPR